MNRTLVSAAVVLLLSACFESHTPLGPPGAIARGSSFVGVWRCHTATMESDEIMTITVLPFDEHQLLLELKELTVVDGVEQSSPSDIERYRFYPSQIDAKSRASDTSDKSRGSDTSDKSRGSDTSDKSRGSDTSDKSRASDTSDKSRASDTSDKSRASDTSDKSGPHILWNAQELGLSLTAPAWTFVRISLANKSSLVAQIVQDSALQGKTEQEKLSDLRKRVSDEAIYGEAIRCNRVADAN